MVIMDRPESTKCCTYFGTDELGRDLFIRVMYNFKSFSLGKSCNAIFSCVLGTIIGLYASYFKVLDPDPMRICDGLIAIPGILLAIALIAALGTSSWKCSCSTYNCIYSKRSAYSYVPALCMVIRDRLM